LQDLWLNVGNALEFLRFDRADFYPDPSLTRLTADIDCYAGPERRHERRKGPQEGMAVFWQSPLRAVKGTCSIGPGDATGGGKT